MHSLLLVEDDRPQDATVLFAQIERPRRAYFTANVTRRPVLWSAGFFAIMMALAVLLAVPQFGGDMPDATLDLLPAVAVMTLLIGVPAFPLRMVAVPVAAYLATFTAYFLLKLWADPGYLPPGVAAGEAFWLALVANGAPGLLAGLAAQGVLLWLGPDHPQAQTLLSGMVALAYGVLSLPVVWWVATTCYDPAWDSADFGKLELWQAGAIGAFRSGLSAGVILLFLLDVPTRKHVKVALATTPVFVAAGVLANMGIALYPPVDVMVLCLVVALFTVSFAAILACIMGLLSYVTLTGAIVVMEPLATTDAVRLEVLSLVLIAITYVLLLVRHQNHLDAKRNSATLDRMQRVNRFANIGYFVFDTAKMALRVDPVAAEYLQLGRMALFRDVLQRIAEEDRPRLVAAMRDRRNPGGAVTSFTLMPPPDATEGTAAKPRYIALYYWNERLWDHRRVSYGAIVDLTDEHENAAALGKALADLSEQQDRQTQLFSIVSHELRTPASVISMLLEEMENGAPWEESGPRLRAVSDQLLSVLADMRQTVRPEQNLPVRMEPLQPQELATTVRNTFVLMAAEKRIEIDLELAPQAWATRVTDRVRLMQALSNLVKNAILHAQCRRITIGYAEEGGNGAITGIWTVTDDGRGIPEEVTSTLFDAFRRGTSRSTARADGSGLGLFVTKSSVELLGGTVTYRAGKDGGSVFTLGLPMPEPAADDPAPAEGKTRTEADGPAYRDRSVLVAEDSEMIGELMVARLKRLFGTVHWARNGVEALEIHAREKVDLVLSDLFMPEMGGDDLTAALRARGATIPIIGMTAAAIGDDRQRFDAAGTDRVLTKPVSTAQLLEVLDGLGPDW
ncbi:hybrid sensor histidine kinase/response regulator [Rhodobacteraceae bacterium HSP-20]|uniref:histidine kinase n=1 Tax=Paragemmobacter amnigenus TaxID=2852097 RepID=A0ABS6JBV2_9RHOB|nr:hybrid sensor histidine kinase/response regulator [Rhodobacter amnigenus]MBU9699957.1 hybrid sensor histidine kinase/response regulator [Rhodobacter amnigenus]MBV4391184.1 hybrid sensor histidine kinase/response regulator [Rhodobacter amnigenus]